MGGVYLPEQLKFHVPAKHIHLLILAVDHKMDGAEAIVACVIFEKIHNLPDSLIVDPVGGYGDPVDLKNPAVFSISIFFSGDSIFFPREKKGKSADRDFIVLQHIDAAAVNILFKP